ATIWVYPRLLPRVRAVMLQHDEARASFDSAPALRQHQIEVLPREVTFRNPAALAAWLSLGALALWLIKPAWRRHPLVTPALLGFNLIPVIMVAAQFTPRHPIRLWHELQAGGPEQQRLMKVLRGTPLRLREVAPGANEMAVPFAMPI